MAFALASDAAGVLSQLSQRVRTGGGRSQHARSPSRMARQPGNWRAPAVSVPLRQRADASDCLRRCQLDWDRTNTVPSQPSRRLGPVSGDNERSFLSLNLARLASLCHSTFADSPPALQHVRPDAGWAANGEAGWASAPSDLHRHEQLPPPLETGKTGTLASVSRDNQGTDTFLRH